MKLRILSAALVAACLWGQEGQQVSISIGPPLSAYTDLLFYSGSDLQYICIAKSVQPTATFAVSGATPFVLTSVVVATNVGTVTTASAHGLAVNDKVVFTGATVDPDLNSTYKIATVGSTTTFTIATVSVSDGTYNNAGLQFTTTAPRSTQPIWSIQKLTSVASAVTATQWAVGTTATNQICDNRGTLNFQ